MKPNRTDGQKEKAGQTLP